MFAFKINGITGCGVKFCILWNLKVVYFIHTLLSIAKCRMFFKVRWADSNCVCNIFFPNNYFTAKTIFCLGCDSRRVFTINRQTSLPEFWKFISPWWNVLKTKISGFVKVNKIFQQQHKIVLVKYCSKATLKFSS